MGIVKVIGVVFSLIGLGSLIGLPFAVKSTTRFLAAAQTAEGEVTDVVSERDSDGDLVQYPIVTFTSRDGEQVQFKGSTSTSSSNVGTKVTVKFVPGDEQNAKIDGFLDVWGLVLFLSVFGIGFGGLGGLALVMGIRMGWIEKDSPEYTQSLQAKIIGIERDTSVKINGRSPWRVLAQAHDPATNSVREFKSKAIWYDPHEYITQDTIQVKCHPVNPRRYFMDVSFLPRKA